MYIRMLIFLEVIMKEFKDYFSKSEIVLWSSSVMVIIISFCFVLWGDDYISWNDNADGNFCLNIMAEESV